jgi:V-type H+-transporting ATPase subunit a
MGFFSFYCGFVYNDYLSINLDLFGSCYEPTLAQEGGAIPRKPDCVYPFGLDPVWGISSNGLTYVNSMKMKIAVIIGVIHMSVGVLLKAFNAVHFRKWMDFFFEFVPQIIFLILLFGYMDFLIIYKWTVDWGLYPADAPSIITTMINLPLGLGKTQDCCGAQPMWGTVGNTSQDSIQLNFLIISLLCIPMMLLPKPLY